MKFEFDLTKVNKNNRRYTNECLQEAVAVYKEKKYKYGLCGQQRDLEMDIGMASHEITEIDISEDGVISGEIMFMGTNHGTLAKTLFDKDIPLAIVPRGIGVVSLEDGVSVITDYEIISMDIIPAEESSL